MPQLRRLILTLPLLWVGPAFAQPLLVQSGANGPLLAQACLGCHGPGAAGQYGVPTIAGRPAPELVAQMTQFRANERPGTIMGRIARGYTSEEIAAVATYLAQAR